MHFLRHRHYSGGRRHLTGRFGLGDIYLEGFQACIHSEAAVRRLLLVGCLRNGCLYAARMIQKAHRSGAIALN